MSYVFRNRIKHVYLTSVGHVVTRAGWDWNNFLTETKEYLISGLFTEARVCMSVRWRGVGVLS